jgi:O-antigen/teichoic acid export membrane protein
MSGILTSELNTRASCKPVPLPLKKNMQWTFLGNSAYGACQWAIIVIITKMGTPEMVGQFALGLAICAPVFTFANLNLRIVQATDARCDYHFGHFMGLRLLSIPGALLVIGAIILISGYSRQIALVVLAVAVIRSLADTIYGALQQREYMDRIGISLFMRSALSILVLIAILTLTGQVLWGTLGLALAIAIILICYDIGNGVWALNLSKNPEGESFIARWREGVRVLHPLWEKTKLRSLFRTALPLGVVWMLISLSISIPRYYIEHYMGTKELGVFAALFQLMLAGTIVVMAICQAAQPRMAQYFAAGNFSAFRRLLFFLSGTAVLLGVIGILAAYLGGQEILTLLYRRQYGEYIACFRWMMVASVFYYLTSALGFGLTATRNFDRLFLPYLVAVGISALCSWLLIPAFGLLGAAWTLGVVNLLVSFMLAIILILLSIKISKNKLPGI